MRQRPMETEGGRGNPRTARKRLSAPLALLLSACLFMPMHALWAQQKDTPAKKGRDVLVHAIRAAGGADRFKKISNFRITTRNKIFQNRITLELEVTETIQLPDKTKQVWTLPAGTRVQVLNGNRGWSAIGGQISELSETEKREMRRGLFRDTIRLFKMADDKELQVAYFGEEDVAGHKAFILQIKNAAGDFFNLHIDSESYQVVKKTYQGAAEVGFAKLEERYAEFRQVEGITLPFRIEVLANGHRFIESTVVAASFNLKLPEDFFTKESL